MVIVNRSVEVLVKNTASRVNIDVLDDSVFPPVAIDATTGPYLDVLDASGNVVHRDGFPSFTLTGTVTITASTTLVTGTNTKFNTEVVPGDTLTIAATARVVESIQSDTQLILTSVHPGASGATATKTTRIVHPATGQYYILWGDSNAPTNIPDQLETSTARDFFFQWRLVTTVGTEEQKAVQVARIVSTRTMSLLPSLRLMIDKMVKDIDENALDPIFIGYSDWMLIDGLLHGLALINGFQPTIGWGTLDEYPVSYHGAILLYAAFYHLLTCQAVFAIDADQGFSDQGNSYTFDRWAKLNATAESIWAKLEKIVPPMKLQYVSSGAVAVEINTSLRYYNMLTSAPTGALFRNLYLAGAY